jgi:S-adenosylmethionine:tRNA ribosyltransferase-isomerase
MLTISELKYVAANANTNQHHTPSFSGGRRLATGGLAFHLPPELEAGEPPEARGLARDEVRLMVSYHPTNEVVHTHFRDLPDYLEPGDLVVINTSGTLNAALPVTRPDGVQLELHLSTRLPADLWIVELRQPEGGITRPFEQGVAGERLTLPAGASATLLTPYLSAHRPGGPTRLWLATIQVPALLSFENYLAEHGHPIRYYYVKQAWPSAYYQTVYATEPGSAEMPSAGRAFTPELMTRLVAHGVQIASLILHTGVASLEKHEPPYEEFYRVPLETARLVNAAHAAGKRVIAVGTTVVRALETVTDAEGLTHPGEGWTRLVIAPPRRLQAVTGLLTGFHEPEASHLAMLQALTGLAHLEITYAEALAQGYLWHEFGDLHLILP